MPDDSSGAAGRAIQIIGGPQATRPASLAGYLHDLRSIVAFGIEDWARPPFFAGCHVWKPGAKSWDVGKELVAFALEDGIGKEKRVHVCGEAFSEYQGFIEGALQTAHDVALRILRSSS